MEHSRPCTINSFEGQTREKRQITNPENAEVIKGLAQMDGAFVIREDGYIEASGRHFIIDNLVLKIPKWLRNTTLFGSGYYPDDKRNRVCGVDYRGEGIHYEKR